MRKKSLLLLMVCLCLMARHALADSVTIGTSYELNGFPFSNSYSGEYQQIYTSSAFTGPVDITAITFFSDTPGAISGTYTLSLSTTKTAVNDLIGDYAHNLGTNNTIFFTGATNNTLTFNGSPFLYDPTMGNLLLDVFTVNSTDANALYAGDSNDTSRAFNFTKNGGTFVMTETGGLQTQFTYTSVTATTPEPSSFVLLGTGLAAMLCGFWFRRAPRLNISAAAPMTDRKHL